MQTHWITNRLYLSTLHKGGKMMVSGRVCKDYFLKDGKYVLQTIEPNGSYEIMLMQYDELIKTITKKVSKFSTVIKSLDHIKPSLKESWKTMGEKLYFN